ncbi:MAG: CDP-alcohol phosphatidyltransferase family protein [Clostridia bacterium]|nr:CDP-alcohol phosphatidyltransferase family protein [Clostridia bacterium]
MSPKQASQRILTIPNILSMLRLVMIPAAVYLYLSGSYAATAVVIVLSGLTDVVDGYIARRCNAVTDLGKALDPVADKLTQLAMLLCLISRHPAMLAPFILLLVKEAFSALSGLMVIRKTGTVLGAQWHGKVTTLMLYALMIMHVVWKEIPDTVSNISIILCIAMMLLSLVLYARRNISAIRSASRS